MLVNAIEILDPVLVAAPHTKKPMARLVVLNVFGRAADTAPCALIAVSCLCWCPFHSARILLCVLQISNH